MEKDFGYIEGHRDSWPLIPAPAVKPERGDIGGGGGTGPYVEYAI